jgi:hypothetical protein
VSEIKAAMPGLFWMAEYAQSRPSRSFLAVISIQVRNNGAHPENQWQDQCCVSVMTCKNLFLNGHSGLDPESRVF